MPLQIFELRRFGADELRGQATVPLHSLPKKCQPQYRWIDVVPPHENSNMDTLNTSGKQSERNRIHVRLEFTDQEEKSACWAMDVTLRGIGVAIIDCVSTRITRELMFVHIMGVRVRLFPIAVHIRAVHKLRYNLMACRGVSDKMHLPNSILGHAPVSWDFQSRTFRWTISF